MFLYFTQHLSTDIANATQDLSKVMDGAEFLDVHCIIRNLLYFRNLGLKIEGILLASVIVIMQGIQ